MRYASIIGLCLLLIVTIFPGGASAKQHTGVGFLTDYSRLKPTEDTAEADLRYVNMKRLKTYDKFIVNPVVVQFYEKSKAQQKLDQEDIATVTVYFRAKIVEALSKGGYAIVSEPGPGVALLRIALTDIVTSKWYLNVLPQMRLTGMGMGGSAMEAELLDSQSGEQIAAGIDNRKAGRIGTGAGFTKTDAARAVIRLWAEQFVALIDRAHGR